MIIKKISEEITRQVIEKTLSFDVNGKKVKVETYFEDDIIGGYDDDENIIYPKDNPLTDEEKATFEAYLQDLWELGVGQEMELDTENQKELAEQLKDDREKDAFNSGMTNS